MITPHDLDLPEQAAAVTQAETVKPKKNSPEFEAHDARMKPENRESALNHLSALRSMLENDKADKEAATAAQNACQSRARLRSKANLYAQVRTQRPTRRAA
tara:strand:+ start:943 stop:1245 length:303 start_codon:yes stop_codon:yes gene_type:complete